MTETTPAPTLDVITGEIKHYLGNIAENIVAIGQRLILAKGMLKYGAWQNWLRDNFAMTDRTARNYMHVAERFGKTENVFRFQPSALMELAKLSDAEITDFLAATPTAADMSIRDLRKAIRERRPRDSQPAGISSTKANTEPVTIDMADTSSDEPPAVTLTFDASDTVTPATIFSTAPPTPTTPVTFTPAPTLPTKVEQLSLFDLPALPALPPRYELPTLVTEAAAKIDTPVYVVPRPTKAEFPAPSILLVLATLSASWTQRLIAKATAFIMTKIPVQRSDGRTARKSVLIVYNGDNSDAFSNAFRYFGLTFFANQKSSAATNNEALL